MDVKQKRNIAVVGHAHCGKTSLTESILATTGAVTRKGDVMQGNTVSDFNDDEIERRISINASFMSAKYQNHEMQLIDTPGYSDFIGETVAALKAADSAIVVIDAVNGVEVGTEDIWDRLNEQNLPRIIFINKSDKSEAKVDDTIAAIRDQLSKNASKIDLESSDLIEAVAETDDQLIEKYLEQGSLSSEEVKGALRKSILDAKVFPIITGSSLKDEGVKELLEAIISYMPSPIEHAPFKAKDPKEEDEKEIIPSADGAFKGFVFKSMFDPHLGQLSLVRVIKGSLDSNAGCFNLNTNIKESVSTITKLQGKEQIKVSQATCGDIVALPKLKNSHVSDNLSADKTDKLLVNMVKFPEPSISASIKPKTRADEEKISTSLHKICEEDHTLRVTRDNETKEMIISGVGDLHLKIVLDRMKSRYNVEVDLGTPKVNYREAITKTATARYKYKKQSGGRGQYGDVELKVVPLPRDGEEYEFLNEIFGGAIPRNYIPSVEKGVKQAISEGVLAKYPITHLQVTVYDGSYHEVDSSDMAFQIAGGMALKDAVKKAGLVLLEPIMDISVVVPGDYIGQISGDISSRRGRIMGTDAKGKNEVIKANVPLSELFKYATDLRSMTGGRGSYSMKFSHYEQAPSKITDQVIAMKQSQEK